MDEQRISRASRPRTPERSSRHHRCDLPFLELLEEDFGIQPYDLQAAFVGVPSVPKKEAIALCVWAERATTNPDERGRMLRAWAKKNGKGSYDPRLVDAPEVTYEQSAHERRVREGGV